MSLFADRDALQSALAALNDVEVARVSLDLPLRANLSALDNIALIPLYQRHIKAVEAGRQAMVLLDQLDHTSIAQLRDPDMTASQRFVTQLARALVLQRSRLIVDRPGAMLYDVAYPAFIKQLAARVPSGTWEIFDYQWNQCLHFEERPTTPDA